MAPSSTALTDEELKQWLKNPLVNPRTGRPITESGAVFKSIKKQADELIFSEGRPRHDVSGRSGTAQTRNDAIVGPGPASSTSDAPSTRITEGIFPSPTVTPPSNPTTSSSVPDSLVPEVISSKRLLSEIPSLLESREGPTMSTSDKLLVNKHAARASYSYEKPFPISDFRNLETCDIPDPFKYSVLNTSPTLRMLTVTNCHDGQRKLTMALLEFVSYSLKKLKCPAKDVLLVYPGASGLASAIASSIFPSLRMMLYDPAPNTLSHMPGSFHDKAVFYHANDMHPSAYENKRLAIFTGKAGWFDDGVATFCKNVVRPYFGAKHLLFTSDVRSNIGEYDIAENMHEQMRWTVLTGCSAYMHKFRMPYLDDDQTPRVLRRYADLSDIPAHLYQYKRDIANSVSGASSRVTPIDDNDNIRIPYLDGELHVQLYARQRTEELRLMGLRPGRDDKFLVRDYHVQNIENKMATFNAMYRSHARFCSSSSIGNPPMFTSTSTDACRLPSTYEIMAERDIVRECTETNESKLREEEDVERVHTIIRDMLATFTHKDPLICSLVSAHAEMKKRRLSVEQYAPHVLTWTRQILTVRPHAAVPMEFRKRVTMDNDNIKTGKKDKTPA